VRGQGGRTCGECRDLKFVILSKRKAFVLRITPELFRQVEKWAEDEFRSVNGQLEWIIHKSLKEAKRLPQKERKGQTGPEGKEP
jgi:hypothetical protein